MIRIAILDDYQRVALEMAGWTPLKDRCAITVFGDHEADEDRLAARLAPFDILCVMRERTPLTASLLARLPNLKLVCSTGARDASIDAAAAAERGIEIAHTGYSSTSTVEMTWAMILGIVRHIASEAASVRAGGWQQRIGGNLAGRTLGILGLGSIGSEVARIAQAFGMTVIAWSQNLTAERAEAVGARLVTREALFAEADILSIHLVLSGRTRGLVDRAALGGMKPGALLINCSRGPIVEEAALIEALQSGRIAGAALDVYDLEPLGAAHPFRTLPTVMATPHIGYVTEDLYRTFYGDTVRTIASWLERSEAVDARPE